MRWVHAQNVVLPSSTDGKDFHSVICIVSIRLRRMISDLASLFLTCLPTTACVPRHLFCIEVDGRGNRNALAKVRLVVVGFLQNYSLRRALVYSQQLQL